MSWGRIRHRVATPAFAAVLAAMGCNLSTGPAPLPDGAVPFDPPAHYALWWSETQQCAGRGASLHDVQWFVVPDAETFRLRGKEWAGWWWASGNRIILAELYREHALTVRHEMLHAILQRGDHPAQYFADRCRGLVEP